MFVGCKVHLEQIGVEIFDNLIDVEGKEGSGPMGAFVCSLITWDVLWSRHPSYCHMETKA